MTTSNQTVADVLPSMAASQPDVTAMYVPTKRRDADGQLVYTRISYRELDQRSDHIAAGLHAVGIERGHRAAIMVRPSAELFALTFGMFKAGVVPVMIDPGLGIRGLGRCIARAKPSAFIGIPVAHAARLTLGWGRATIRHTVNVGGWGLAKHTLQQVERIGAKRVAEGYRRMPTRGNEVAAVLFTSGSTGPPKGVVYRHRNFLAQVEAIRKLFSIEPGEIDLPTFPMFALFDPALGMTTVLPDMDPTRPADVDPRNVIEPIQRFGITTILRSTWHDTEQGAGVCVGAPVPDIEIKVIQISDEPIASFSDGLELPDGEVGEIAVRGPMVTEEYFGDERSTALAKIRDGDTIWHRMGDLGWRDASGRLWFCGRKSHRVTLEDETMFTVPCEKVFDTHPAVYRSALVAPLIGGVRRPTLCVELEPGSGDWGKIEREILATNDEALSTVAIRPHLVWGPGDTSVLPRLVARAKSGRLRMVGQPQPLDTTYIDNAVSAHLLAYDRLSPGSPVAGRAYFITQDEPLPGPQFINDMLDAVGLPPVTRSVSATFARSAAAIVESLWKLLRLYSEPPITRYLVSQLSTAHWYDISAARRDLGYQPNVSYAEGMKRLKAWAERTMK